MEKQKKDNQGIVFPFAVIYLLRFSEFLNPYLGMRLAAFFFSKPFSYKRPKREIPIFNKAKRSYFHVKSLNKKIYCYRWEGSGSKILLVHGWSSRATNFFKIIEKLALLNYDIYAFDAPAHGESKGIITNLPEFIYSVEELIEVYGPFDAVLGHSGGGFTSAYVVAQKPQIKKLILISSFDKITDIFEKYFEIIQLGEKPRNMMVKYFSQKTDRKIEELATSLFGQLIMAKTLVIHDEDDREVEFSDGVNIEKNIKNGKLIITQGLGHRRILRDEEVINEIGVFLETH